MKNFSIIIVMLCVVFFSSTAFADNNWVWLHSDNVSTIYVNNNSIRRDTKQSGYVFYAVLKAVLTDAGRAKWIETMRSQGITGIQNLSHITYLQYYKSDNGNKYYSTGRVVFFDYNGNKIKEINKRNLDWGRISPGDVEETLFDNIRARVPN